MTTSTHARRRRPAAVAPASSEPAKRGSRSRGGRQRGEAGPPEDRYDDAVPGSLFRDREAPPESSQVEGAIDDWPGIDGEGDHVPAEPAESRRR